VLDRGGVGLARLGLASALGTFCLALRSLGRLEELR
jgi:hypothetical protein